jgi:probable rRNA maturation factor
MRGEGIYHCSKTTCVAAGDVRPCSPDAAWASGGMAGIEVVPGTRLPAGVDVEWLAARLRACAAAGGLAVARVTVRIAGDREMARLHRRHRGVNSTTDVLTFAASAPGEAIEADVVICADEAARRAAELGHGVGRELLLYALHGMLHGAGFTDADEASHAAMHAEEDRILEAIGVGRTFERGEGASARGEPGAGGDGR